MILKNPTKPNNFRESIFFFKSARSGFRHLLKNLKFPKDGYILLPSYIGYSAREGSGVFDPIAECGIKYSFYRVGKNLSADMDDLRNRVLKYKPIAVLIIHYFGFMQSSIEEIKDLCKEHSCYIVEDCAHCLSSRYKNIPLGNFGDFSLFSIHKNLPARGGGILKVNKKVISLPVADDDDAISFEDLEIFSTSDIEAISRIRIDNYNLLLRLLSPLSGIDIPYPKLPDGITPMNFPVFIKTKSRHDIYQGLLGAEIETMALYYQLIQPILEESYPLSHEISRSILNLPIHQDLNENDMRIIASNLRDLLGE